MNQRSQINTISNSKKKGAISHIFEQNASQLPRQNNKQLSQLLPQLLPQLLQLICRHQILFSHIFHHCFTKSSAMNGKAKLRIGPINPPACFTSSFFLLKDTLLLLKLLMNLLPFFKTCIWHSVAFVLSISYEDCL